MAPPQTERRAVIDIGTNSVKLLVADVCGRVAEPLLEKSEQTRLGRGLYEEHRLQPAAIDATALAVATFASAARDLNASDIRAIATSAARDAVNSADLLGAVELSSGLAVEVIPGELEADYVFQGVTTDPVYATGPILIVDVGGGSTEFIVGNLGQQIFRQSFPLGTVRVLEKHPVSDPPNSAELKACRERIAEYLRSTVIPLLGPVLMAHDAFPKKPIMIGTGGTTTIMARIQHRMTDYDRKMIEGTKFLRSDIRGTVERLWGLELSDRRRIPGLPANRADVMLFGVAIFEGVMEALQFDELRVSTRGLRFGAILKG